MTIKSLLEDLAKGKLTLPQVAKIIAEEDRLYYLFLQRYSTVDFVNPSKTDQIFMDLYVEIEEILDDKLLGECADPNS